MILFKNRTYYNIELAKNQISYINTNYRERKNAHKSFFYYYYYHQVFRVYVYTLRHGYTEK